MLLKTNAGGVCFFDGKSFRYKFCYNRAMKTFVWIVGKPGCGKTTVARLLENQEDSKVFSYGKLLREAQPRPGVDGYSLADYERVNEILNMSAMITPHIIIDGNPYSKLGFDSLSEIMISFDVIKIVHLKISDEVALRRLEARGFPIHDEEIQQERIYNFNRYLLPIIRDYAQKHNILEIDAQYLSPVVIVSKILQWV